MILCSIIQAVCFIVIIERTRSREYFRNEKQDQAFATKVTRPPSPAFRIYAGIRSSEPAIQDVKPQDFEPPVSAVKIYSKPNSSSSFRLPTPRRRPKIKQAEPRTVTPSKETTTVVTSTQKTDVHKKNEEKIQNDIVGVLPKPQQFLTSNDALKKVLPTNNVPLKNHSVNNYSNPKLKIMHSVNSHSHSHHRIRGNSRGAGSGLPPQTLLQYYYGEKTAKKSWSTPCTFPTPNDEVNWQKCGVEPEASRKYNVCDPESTTYFSKMDALFKVLDDIEYRKGDHCLCPLTTSPHCWYKFAFVFLNELKFPIVPLPDDIDLDELCDSNITTTDYATNQHETTIGLHSNKVTRQPVATPAPWYTSRQAVINYGNKFADFMRRRWRLGNCQEDILILAVKNAPTVVTNSNVNQDKSSKPAIFVSYGNLVQTRSDHVTRPHNYNVKSLDEAVYIVNDILQGNGENSTLEKGLVILVTWYEQVLTVADQTFLRYSPKARQKSHIPPTWALGAFAGCGLLLLLMALGSCLVRTRVRRSIIRSKQTAGDANRHWKAGFVGGMFQNKSFSHDHSVFSNPTYIGGGESQRSRSFLDIDSRANRPSFSGE